ncbi:Ribosomal protein L7/L12 domain protein [Cooperia oncophora]
MTFESDIKVMQRQYGCYDRAESAIFDVPTHRTRLREMRNLGNVKRSKPKLNPPPKSLDRLPLTEGAPAPLPSEEHVPSPKVAALVEEIANLSLLDVNFSDIETLFLVNLFPWLISTGRLKKRLNIADQPMMPAGMMMAAQAPAPAAEAAGSAEPDVPQKMTFSVKLTKFDDAKKIALIKEIRSAISGLNLVQAKKFVETAPVVVREDMGKAEAEELKAALEKAGATIEIV